MGAYAADIETTGLLEQMMRQENPHLHCMGFRNMVTNAVLLFSNRYSELVNPPAYVHCVSKLYDFLDKGHTLYMHNGIGFDVPALKMLGYHSIDKCTVIDSLGLSWYLEPKRISHGLAGYGEDFGVPKPDVEEWENQPQEVYNHRVMEDVKIQYLLSTQQDKELKAIYGSDTSNIINYLNMKMKHIAIQQGNKWKLDVPATEKLFAELSNKLDDQVVELKKVMPQVPVKVLKEHPAKAYKANGKLSTHGKNWYTLLLKEGMPIDTTELVVIKGYDEPNPNSPAQIKEWLYSFGWVPETFKYERDKETGKERKIPQVNVADSGGEVDPGILKLHDKYPEQGFNHIQGLGILKHRVGMVKGFLENQVDEFLSAGASGLTNTLRLKHRTLVNIPSVRVPYGKEIRSLLISGNNKLLLGSDLSSLEDKCKHHYQWKYDPEYVKMQQSEGFDPHLLMCEMAELLTPQQVQDHKDKKADYSRIRHAGKSCNYASQYGAGAPTIARAAGVSLDIGEKLHKAYHDLNWSIGVIAENTKTKKANGMTWQLNPVNGLWYWLKSDKDRFSTLCQGTGSYICDMWIESCHVICREKYGTDAPIIGEFHDELIMRVNDSATSKDTMTKVVDDAMDMVNDIVKCNVTFGCEIKFGHNYAEVH